MGDFYNFLQLCRKNKVSVFLPGLAVDLDSPSGEIMLNMIVVFAQYERQMIAQRTSSSIRYLVKTKAKIHGQPLIFGFKKDDNEVGRWIPVKEELEAVIHIMELFVKYKCLRVTSERVNALGVKTKTGKALTSQSLKRLLINRKYIGKLNIPGGEGEVDLPFGPQVPLGLFERVQEIILTLQSEFKNKTRNQEGSTPFPAFFSLQKVALHLRECQGKGEMAGLTIITVAGKKT